MAKEGLQKGELLLILQASCRPLAGRGSPENPREKEEKAKEKRIENPKRTSRKIKPAAVLVTPEGKSYADILAKMTAGVDVDGIRANFVPSARRLREVCL